MYYFSFPCSFGTIYIVEKNQKIIRITTSPMEDENILCQKTPLIAQTIEELEQYFKGERKTFSIPIALKGTVFQEKVWQALTEIPYGVTVSYKDIAEKVGSPKAYRAVGTANGRNPIMIVVPCHRVINENGALGGYSGGIEIKKELLKLEKSFNS